MSLEEEEVGTSDLPGRRGDRKKLWTIDLVICNINSVSC